MPVNVYQPAKLQPGTLRVIPIGGLGEIGRNMTSYEIDGKILIVDCGVLFPEETQPGVDLILPDFSPIRDRLDDVLGIVLTHGHEDHIGAVPYLLKLRADIPLIGSTLTLALVEAKLKEHRITPYSLTVTEGQTEQLGPFELEFIAVNHSIPDALAVAIKTRPASCCTPATSRWTSCRWMTASPTCARSRVSARRASTCSCPTRRTRMFPGFTALERDIGPVLESCDRESSAPRDRRQLLEPRSPRAAGAGCRRRERPQGRAHGPLDGAQHGHRGRPRLPQGSGRRAHRGQEGRRPARQQARLHVDRKPGRADGRARAHGEPGAPDRGGQGRHGHPRVEPHPGQRERGLPRHQRSHEARRDGRAQGQREGARLRATPPPANCSTCTTS